MKVHCDINTSLGSAQTTVTVPASMENYAKALVAAGWATEVKEKAPTKSVDSKELTGGES